MATDALSDQPLARRLTRCVGVYALLAGATSLLGWVLDVPRLTDWEGAGLSIQPNTTIAVMAAGASLLFLAGGMRIIALVLGLLVLFVGGSAIFQYLTGVDLGIDQLLLFDRTWGARGTIVRGRMGPPGAVSWTVLGIGLIFAARGGPSTRGVAPILGLAAVGISSLSLVGYLYGIDALYAIPHITVIALQTSTMILAVGVGVMCAVPDRQPVRLLLEPGSTGMLVRRTLPILVLVPILVGWLRQQGEDAGFYDSDFGSAIRSLVEVGFLTGLLWWTATIIAARERQLAEATAEREGFLERERSSRNHAVRANRLKDEFLATLSHELRTPLNAILGWAQVLRAKPPTPELVEQGVAVIERNARVQAQLIADLLDMSAILSGKMRLEVQPVDLPAVIAAALDSVQPAAQAKGVRLEWAVQPKADPIQGDPARLQQVVWNLVSNAVRFTPRDGRIVVSLARRATHVVLSVRDTGKGIEPEFLDHVFERFRQADSSTTRVHGGLGIGLAIVKQLVELHGGRVHAESEGEDRGSTFVVELPLAAPRSPDAVVAPPPAEPEPEILADGPEVRLDGVRILVVDDDEDARVLLRRFLEECRAVVAVADSAATALACMHEREPDVLISDIAMPGMDGYQLIARARALGYRMPAIALTAYARTEDRLRALAGGYQSHVSKPVKRRELAEAVAAALGRMQRA